MGESATIRGFGESQVKVFVPELGDKACLDVIGGPGGLDRVHIDLERAAMNELRDVLASRVQYAPEPIEQEGPDLEELESTPELALAVRRLTEAYVGALAGDAPLDLLREIRGALLRTLGRIGDA